MTAAVLEALNSISVKTVPEPACGDDEAMLEVNACAVCGSDIRIFHYGNDRVKPPTVIGHEIAGRIVKAGRAVTRVKEGQRIALGADVPCGVCKWCTSDMGTNCAINYAIGYQFPGGFQQRMVLNATTLNYGPVTPIPDGLSYCGSGHRRAPGMRVERTGACEVRHRQKHLHHRPGAHRLHDAGALPGVRRLESVCCPAFAASAWRWRGSSCPEARFIATEEENLVDTVMKETGGEGVDLVITTAGSVQAHEDAIRMVAHRGYVNLFGGLKNQPKLSFDSNLIHYKECFVMGSHGSLPRHHRVAVDLIERGAVHAKKYLSAMFPLEKTAEAFAYHESRAGLKVIVAPARGEGGVGMSAPRGRRRPRSRAAREPPCASPPP